MSHRKCGKCHAKPYFVLVTLSTKERLDLRVKAVITLALHMVNASKSHITTVDCKTIGGNAKALSGYPTTHQILVVEEVSREYYVVSAVVLI